MMIKWMNKIWMNKTKNRINNKKPHYSKKQVKMNLHFKKEFSNHKKKLLKIKINNLSKIIKKH